MYLEFKQGVLLLVNEEDDLYELLIYSCPCNCCSLPSELFNKIVALSTINITNNMI